MPEYRIEVIPTYAWRVYDAETGEVVQEDDGYDAREPARAAARRFVTQVRQTATVQARHAARSAQE